MNSVVVIGSINVDHVIDVDNLPSGGETIIGKDINIVGGGKGANQAVSCSRLGSSVTMLAMVGNDEDGRYMLDLLKKDNIDISRIKIIDGKTGSAIIMVDNNAENSIIVLSGANYMLTKEYIDENVDVIKGADYVVLQNEIPLDIVEYCLELSKKFGKKTVYNNAPAKKIDEKYFKYIDYLIVNEVELNTLCTHYNELFDKGINNIVLTLGKKGSKYISKKDQIDIEAIKVNAIDTTAAGDTYIGAFVSMFDGTNIKQAMQFATKASAIAVTRKGAQTSIPNIEEVK